MQNATTSNWNSLLAQRMGSVPRPRGQRLLWPMETDDSESTFGRPHSILKNKLGCRKANKIIISLRHHKKANYVIFNRRRSKHLHQLTEKFELLSNSKMPATFLASAHHSKKILPVGINHNKLQIFFLTGKTKKPQVLTTITHSNNYGEQHHYNATPIKESACRDQRRP